MKRFLKVILILAAVFGVAGLGLKIPLVDFLVCLKNLYFTRV